MALDENIEDFVVHMGLFISQITIYPARKVQIALLIADKVSILVKYLGFADGFSKELLEVFFKRTGINKYTIKLKKDNQLSYWPIYSLNLVELKIFKTYIETTLTNSFIQPLKSFTNALIFFDCKPNSSLCLCVDYCRLNNLIIENWYLLPLIGEYLDWLKQVKQFT